MKNILRKIGLWVLGIFLCLFLIGKFVGDNKGENKTKEQPLEYTLAVIDAGESVSEDDIRIARFRSLLTQLSSKYAETPEKIGNMTAFIKQKLHDNGINESMLNIMEGINTLPVGNQKYDTYLTLYLSSRIGSMTHEETITGLRQIANGLGMR